MEIQFDITEKYEKEFSKLSTKDQKSVALSIDKYAASFDVEKGDVTGKVFQLHKIQLPTGLDSSLYVLRSTQNIRVILTIEEDPLFCKKIITLMSVVNHDSMEKAYRSVSESLYQRFKNSKPLEGKE